MSDKPKRSPLVPAKLSPEDYSRKVAGHLKNREGAVPRIYTDEKGIPTMGTGIALAASGDGKTYTLRDLKQIDAEISGDPAHPYQFSETEQKLLTDTVEKLNDENLTQPQKLDAIPKLIPSYKPGKETAADNKFGFTLSDERIAQQGAAAWNSHRDRAMQTVRDQAKARGWSKEQTDAYMDSLKGSQQEIALTSLAYNGVPTPKATGAMLDADPVTMRQEILYRSNGDKSAGIADRRKEEAEQQGLSLAEYLQNRLDNPASAGSDGTANQGVAYASLQDATVKHDAVSPPPADPQAAALVEMAGKPVDNPGKAALLKPVEKLTEPEMMDMIHSAQGDYRGWKSGDPLKDHTYEKVQDWHVAMYGDAPQTNDGGKPIEPTPIRPIPTQPSPHTTPDGQDLWQASARLGQKVADAAATDGTSRAVTGLQRGLNILNAANPLPGRSAAYGPYTKLAPVTEDGQYGPQTDFALKHATARLGPHKVEEGLALGRFNTFARDAQRSGNAEGLEAKTHTALGPLFRNPADDKAPKVEGGVLQREDADSVTTAFGRGLGFL